MGRARFFVLCALAACAHALPTGDDDGDSSVVDASIADVALDNAGCPQFDLTKDPQHCGSCTHACAAGEVCASGQCKSQCDSSQTKCASGDGGALCVDVQTDPDHCGTCTTTCTTADAGSLQPGPNNPDAGIPFDGGYDGGIGWSLGTPACDGGACALECPQGLSECSDGICYDTENFHGHCGNCTTACQSTEWCTQGHCCSQGTAYCGGACTDVFSDDANCGACGHACSGGTPVCSAGTCVSAVTFSQSFTLNVTATTQCTAWDTFRGALTGTYSSITMSGTFDAVGHTCTGASANTICQALHGGTAVTNLSCGGYVWNVLPAGGCGTGVTLASNGANNGCACLASADYSARPCIATTPNWGGINTAACPPPSQTITVSCQ